MRPAFADLAPVDVRALGLAIGSVGPPHRPFVPGKSHPAQARMMAASDWGVERVRSVSSMRRMTARLVFGENVVEQGDVAVHMGNRRSGKAAMRTRTVMMEAYSRRSRGDNWYKWILLDHEAAYPQARSHASHETPRLGLSLAVLWRCAGGFFRSSCPYIRRSQQTASATFRPGGHTHRPDMYFSFIRQAYDGNIVFNNRLTATPNSGAFVNLQFLAVGRAMRPVSSFENAVLPGVALCRGPVLGPRLHAAVPDCPAQPLETAGGPVRVHFRQRVWGVLLVRGRP